MKIIPPKENIIFEDHEAKVVLSFDPISKGHVVIIPTESYKDIDELPAKVLAKIMKLTQCYVRLLKSQYNPKGYSIMQNGGDFNDTGEFHLHVFPRNTKEEFSWTYSDLTDKSATEYQKVKDELKNEFYDIFDALQ